MRFTEPKVSSFRSNNAASGIEFSIYLLTGVKTRVSSSRDPYTKRDQAQRIELMRIEWKSIVRGWRRQDFQRAGVMACSSILIVVATLSFPTDNARVLSSQVFAFIGLGLLFPYTSGQAMYYCVHVSILSFIVGGTLCIGTVLAMGPTAPPSTKKAAIAASIATAEATVLQHIRAKYPKWDLMGRMSQIWIVLSPFTAYRLSDVYSSAGDVLAVCYSQPGYFAVGATISLLVITFLLPSLSGQDVRRAMRLLLSKMQKQEEAILDELSKPLNPSSGQLQQAVDTETGKVEEDSQIIGIAEGIRDRMVEMYDFDQSIGENIGAIGEMMKLVQLEIDVYHKPHLFPVKEYSEVFGALVRSEHLLMVMCDILQAGRVPLRCVALLIAPLKKVVSATQEVSSLFGEMLSTRLLFDGKDTVENGVEILHAPLHNLTQECINLNSALQHVSQHPTAYGVDELTEDFNVARMLIQALILAIKQFQVVHGTLAGKQNAQELQTLGSNLWPSAWAQQFASIMNEEVLEAPEIGDGEGSHLDALWLHDHKIVGVEPSNKWRANVFLFKLAELLDLRRHNIKIIMQAAVAFSAACVLVSIPAINNGLLQGHGIWIIINVVTLSEATTGTCMDRSWQRFAGTLLAVFWSTVTFGLVSIIIEAGGGDGQERSGAWVSGIMVSLWMTGCAMVQSRMAPKAFYMWAVSELSVPVLVLADPGKFNDWDALGCRILALLIGLVLVTSTQLFLFPVTAKAWLTVHAVDGLKSISTLIETSTQEIAVTRVSHARPIWEAQAAGMRQTLSRIRDLQRVASLELFKVPFSESVKPHEIRQFTNRLRFKAVRWVNAVLTQEILLQHDAWHPPLSNKDNTLWERSFLCIGAQEAAALRALRLVLRGMATMESAIGTVHALEELVIKVAAALGVDVTKAEGYTEACLLPLNGSPAVLCGLNAAFSGVLAMRRLYRVTARMLLSRQDMALADKELGDPLWWKNNSRTQCTS